MAQATGNVFPEFDKLVAKAEADVKRLDAIDGSKDRELKTILFALEAGLKRPETNAHYDAYVMLKELVEGNFTVTYIE